MGVIMLYNIELGKRFKTLEELEIHLKVALGDKICENSDNSIYPSKLEEYTNSNEQYPRGWLNIRNEELDININIWYTYFKNSKEFIIGKYEVFSISQYLERI